VRLTRLELHGFKSFADHTELVFEPGVTAIVGPNGCGKSNVSDAVRWVLGEQRARTLRGAKMEEVIFQGSSARRAVNVAEVALHFENDDGYLPIPFREVVISRRLSRSGESEYLLNRAPCRLRDIHDLLRGTGLGADAGVVIEARMIDALLSDRPDDRRELFEEAAGVGLYRDRRRSTERRLEETTVDLARLDDLITEVQSQVRSLARQRKRAERHGEITARRYVVDITLAAREMAAWRDELGRLEGEVADLRERVPAGEEQVRQAEAARDAADLARGGAESRRAEFARQVADGREHTQRLRGEMAVAGERQRNALERRQRADEERRAGESQDQRVLAERERFTSDRVRLEGELREAEQEAAATAAREDEARAAVAESRAGLELVEAAVRTLHDRGRRLEIDRESAGRELGEVSQGSAALETELAQLTARAEAARRELSAAGSALETARGAAAHAVTALENARVAAREAREADAAARAEFLRLDEAFSALSGKVNALESLERDRVGLAPAAARLLKDRDQFDDGAVLGPLSDFISAGSATAALVERFLGNTVHAVLVRDQRAAEAIRRWHAEVSPGPLLLLPVDAFTEAEVAVDEHDAVLARHVDASAPARAWVRALLGHVRAMEDGAAFVDARGAMWLPGTAGGPGPLRRRAELSQLRDDTAAASASRRRSAGQAESTRAALAAAEQAALVATEHAAAAQQAARQADEHRGEAERRRERVEREVADASAQADRFASRHGELTARLAALDEQTRDTALQLAGREAEVQGERARLADAIRRHEQNREARAAGQVLQAQASARLHVALDREKRLADEHAAAAARLDDLRQELGGLEEADRQLAERMRLWQHDLDARQALLGEVERQLADAELAVSMADHGLRDAGHALDEVRRRVTARAEALHQAELRYSELSGRRTAIRERLETEWRRPLDELLAGAEPLELDDDALRAEAEALRQQIDALGPVNPLAIEEHEEESKRLDFLGAQRDDLIEARQTLQQAIREIDTTARELFLDTFDKVRENFRHIFMMLFGGGECELRLENPDLPMDCDIEIHASPRGKRTQRIHLLSSGERALVALSLLFGIFLTKPSPFCLLDEVDAPLDDQNIGRFVRMLNEFKRKTQFIVITHNPRTTTEAADAVYGVTMQEPGVSSLVSVRMRGAAVDEAIAGRLAAITADAPETAAAPA
jgi:chromosome segregation protein